LKSWIIEKSNPLQYDEGEWNNMIIFLSKNLEIKIVAKATNKEKLTITVFKALRRVDLIINITDVSMTSFYLY